MEVTNVTADAEEFTCNASLAPDGGPALVDARAMPGVVGAIGEPTPSLSTEGLTYQHGDLLV